jgi:hypothetical protein
LKGKNKHKKEIIKLKGNILKSSFVKAILEKLAYRIKI